jgi:hypothetical protein
MYRPARCVSAIVIVDARVIGQHEHECDGYRRCMGGPIIYRPLLWASSQCSPPPCPPPGLPPGPRPGLPPGPPGLASTREYARVCATLREYLRVFSGTREYLRVRAGTRDSLRVFASTCEYAQVRASTSEHMRVRMGTCEYLRVLASTLGVRGEVARALVST